MGISKNILIALIFTIFFMISNVHCNDIIPDFGVKHEYKKCYMKCSKNVRRLREVLWSYELSVNWKMFFWQLLLYFKRQN
ncbi:hypothetical protein Bca101_024966 [Brassica carinata]